MADDLDVRLSGVARAFEGKRAVDGVSLEVRRGEFFSLLGPSGCGKTTLLRMIAGFEEPDAGAVELAGRDVRGVPPHRRDVNLVFQDYALFPHLDAGENVAFGLRRQGADRVPVRVAEALARVNLAGCERRDVGTLSGGERQRVALARAIVTGPRVLLLDEPMAALDLQLRAGLRGELRRLQRSLGMTFVMVTHDQEEALAMSDRVAVLREGRVEQVGTPREIYERPATRFVADFVGAGNLFDGEGDGRVLRTADGLEFEVGVRGPATVLLRPERVRLGAGGLEARVEELLYRGAASRATLRAGDRTWIAEGEVGPLRPGDATTLSWRAEDLRVVGR